MENKINLNGSEKQIKWANDIINVVVSKFNELYAFSCGENNPRREQAVATMEKWEASINSKTEAGWWINNRYNLPKERMDLKTAIIYFVENFGR